MAKQNKPVVEAVDAEFEIIETKLVKANEGTKGVQLFDPETKEKVIQGFINAAALSFTLTPAESKKLVKESSRLKIKDKDDVEGFEKVKAANWKLVKARTGTETERKNLTDPFNKIKSGIDAVAKEQILSITAKEEARTKEMLDQWKAWQEEAAAEVARQEKEKLDGRVAELETAGIVFDGNFYSVGTVSVDIVTIKDLTDELFEELKSRVSAEAERIAEIKRVEQLHADRREKALPFIAYWTPEEKNIHFGEVSDEDFEVFMNRIQKAAKDFQDEKDRQEQERIDQANERKALNYEKRSFKLEKEGFEVDDYGSLFFNNETGRLFAAKNILEEMTNDEFEEFFKNMCDSKKELEEKKVYEADRQKEAAENEAKLRVFNFRKNNLTSLGFKHREEKENFVLGLMQVSEHALKTYSDSEWADVIVDIKQKKADNEKQAAAEEEAKRLEKLPDVEKAVRYIEGLIKVEIPALKTPEIESILKEFTTTLLTKSAGTLDKLKQF